MVSEPRYNIRAVERLTDVPAPTLRSWERRYGFPAPQRTLTARRLYSDDDVQAIRWVRSQTEHGLSVAQAIDWFRSAGDARPSAAAPGAAPSPEVLVQALVDGVRRYDEQAVETTFTSAFGHYPADRILLEVIEPALVEVGDLWASGALSVAGEHFFSNIVRRRLLGLLAAQPAITPRMTVALACLPGEQHELGLLMLALFLRWAGAGVIYLGADLPITDLARLTTTREVDAICLSAGREAHWHALDALVPWLLAAERPPRVYVGGGAADRPAPEPIQVLTAPLREAAARILQRYEGGGMRDESR